MLSQENATTKIFVGNIPYDFEEKDLIETLEMVGPIKEIEIKIDEKNNKPKGFGFCHYKDLETRISALNNLKNIDYNGRQLRINTAENEKNIFTTEEELRINRDLSFIKEFNTFEGLKNDDQKSIMFLTCKILSEKHPKEFENLLMNQDENFLNEFLNFQNQMLDKIK